MFDYHMFLIILESVYKIILNNVFVKYCDIIAVFVFDSLCKID